MGGATYGALIHGYARGSRHSPEHAAWTNMIQRCRPESADRSGYFDRGIGVCERWLVFVNFISDMGPRPLGASLDRIDNDRGYEPGNCRWATPKQQARNRRSSRMITALGKTMSIAAWAEETGLTYATIQQRIYRLKWSDERAVTTPQAVSTPRRTENA